MLILALFNRKDKLKSTSARSQSSARGRTIASSTGIQDDYVLPPIPTTTDNWSDPRLFTSAHPLHPSTLRLVSSPPSTSQTAPQLPNLSVPAYAKSNTPSSQPTSPSKSSNRLVKVPQTPSKSSKPSANIPRLRRPSLFTWSSGKSKNAPFQSDSIPTKPSFNSDMSTDIESFNLKSFRHVAPPPQVPPFPPAALMSLSKSKPSSTPLPVISPPPRTSAVKQNPGFQVTSRPRVNSTHSLAESSSSQTVTVGAFRQAARRSTTNLDASPIDDTEDLPIPPLINNSDRPLGSPLRADTPPSSFKGYMENIHEISSSSSKSPPNPTPLQSITGATRRYSGALSSGETKHSRQPAYVANQDSSQNQARKSTVAALPSDTSSSSGDEDTSNRPSPATQISIKCPRARSEMGHGMAERILVSTPNKSVVSKHHTHNSAEWASGSRDPFYRRQRASLSTGALPAADSQVGRSTVIAANAGPNDRSKGTIHLHDDTDTSSDSESESDSSGDDAPLIAYMSKGKSFKVNTQAETTSITPRVKPQHRNKQTLIDIHAPSTFHTADKIRSKRPNTSLTQAPSIRSSRSEENLPPSSRSYAGPVVTTYNSGTALRPVRPPMSETSVSEMKSGSRKLLPTSSTDSQPMSNRTSRATLLPAARTFRDSPPSSTSNGGDSSSGIIPLTPRDGSEIGAKGHTHRKSNSVTFADTLTTKGEPADIQSNRGNAKRQIEDRRRERRRSEAENAIALGNVVNGPGPIESDDDDGYPMRQSMNIAMPLKMQTTNIPQFPSNPSEIWNTWARQSMMSTMPTPSPQQFMASSPPAGANIHFLAAHHQAMLIAKQTYQMAVAQQAMVVAGEEWERNSTVSGVPGWGGSVVFPGAAQSIYAGSVIGGSSTYGGGWGSQSAYGERFGPSVSRTSFVGQSMPPSSFNRTIAKDGPTRQRTRSGVQDGMAPPTSWKNR